MKTKEEILKQFDELCGNLEPEIYTEASFGDIDWKPFRKFLSNSLDQVKQEAERETIEMVLNWCRKHADYDENSDLDPSPEEIISLRSIREYLLSLKSETKEDEKP